MICVLYIDFLSNYLLLRTARALLIIVVLNSYALLSFDYLTANMILCLTKQYYLGGTYAFFECVVIATVNMWLSLAQILPLANGYYFISLLEKKSQGPSKVVPN